jgi:hypothetical protein
LGGGSGGRQWAVATRGFKAGGLSWHVMYLCGVNNDELTGWVLGSGSWGSGVLDGIGRGWEGTRCRR